MMYTDPSDRYPAGMDISELSQITTREGHKRRFLKDLTDAFANFSKPTIAAVVGFAVSRCSCLSLLLRCK